MSKLMFQKYPQVLYIFLWFVCYENISIKWAPAREWANYYLLPLGFKKIRIEEKKEICQILITILKAYKNYSSSLNIQEALV
jgi:hypothetical protein